MPDSLVYVVTNGSNIDSAWLDERQANARAKALNMMKGISLAWSVYPTSLME